MKTIFQPACVVEVKQRIANVHPESKPLWGTMTPAQAMAHCTAAIGMAQENVARRQILIGRLLGPFAKRSLIRKGEPMRRNSPTHPSVLITGPRDFLPERERLLESIDRFVEGGHARCTSSPHFFFGPLTPDEWASLMYQHLDHHLRQFGA